MVNGSSTLVKHSNHNPNIKGLNPAAGTGERENENKKLKKGKAPEAVFLAMCDPFMNEL
jgi:hypothetical protein